MDVRAFSGSTGIDNKELEAATRALAVAVKESELLDQQVSHGQSRTEKLFKATRINFDFQHWQNRNTVCKSELPRPNWKI